MLSRPSDTGHTAFGDIFYSQSPDLEYWGHHRFVMGTFGGDASAWQATKIGPGPVPIETDEGWLLIYHGVLQTCNGFVYRMGCALLDLEQPWKVLYRSKYYILGPSSGLRDEWRCSKCRIPMCNTYGFCNWKNCNLLWLCRHSHRTGIYNS